MLLNEVSHLVGASTAVGTSTCLGSFTRVSQVPGLGMFWCWCVPEVTALEAS